MNLALRARTRAGLSQRKLAKLLGVSRQTLFRWETGQTEPPGVAAAFLRVLEAHPALVLETLESFSGRLAGGGPGPDSEPGSDEPPRVPVLVDDDLSAEDDDLEAGG